MRPTDPSSLPLPSLWELLDGSDSSSTPSCSTEHLNCSFVPTAVVELFDASPVFAQAKHLLRSCGLSHAVVHIKHRFHCFCPPLFIFVHDNEAITAFTHTLSFSGRPSLGFLPSCFFFYMLFFQYLINLAAVLTNGVRYQLTVSWQHVCTCLFMLKSVSV